MVVTLRSGRELESIKEDEQKKTEKTEKEETGKETKKEKVQTVHQQENRRLKKNEERQAYMRAVPFPQRLQKVKMEEQFSRFLDMFKKIEISIPFVEALA